MTQQPERDRRGSNTQKEPDDWTTGDEPMTGAQRSCLETLSSEAGEPIDESLTKADASKRIDELQRATGRGAVREDAAQSEEARAGHRPVDAERRTDAQEGGAGRSASIEERHSVTRAGEWTPEAARDVSKDD